MVDTGEAQIAYEIAPQDGTTEQDHAFPNAETSLLQDRRRNSRRSTTSACAKPLISRSIATALIGTIFHADAQKAMQVVAAVRLRLQSRYPGLDV